MQFHTWNRMEPYDVRMDSSIHGVAGNHLVPYMEWLENTSLRT